MVFVGLSRYTEKDLELLYKLHPDGVILGDLLCNKKMFPYGGTELTEVMTAFKDRGIAVIYQTPLYATDRVFSDIVQTVEYYDRKDLICGVIVQDVGMALRLRKACEKLAIIWGRMGYARTPVVNTDTIAFYMENGINGFECKSLEQADYAKKAGACAYLMVGYPKYLTINRECYYKFEHNIFDDNCSCGCLNREKMVIPACKEIETTLDGFVLGWQNVYTEEAVRHALDYENSIIYAESLSEAEEKYKEICFRMDAGDYKGEK